MGSASPCTAVGEALAASLGDYVTISLLRLLNQGYQGIPPVTALQPHRQATDTPTHFQALWRPCHMCHVGCQLLPRLGMQPDVSCASVEAKAVPLKRKVQRSSKLTCLLLNSSSSAVPKLPVEPANPGSATCSFTTAQGPSAVTSLHMLTRPGRGPPRGCSTQPAAQRSRRPRASPAGQPRAQRRVAPQPAQQQPV